MGKNNRPRGDDRPRRGVRLNALGAQPRALTDADAPYDLPDGWTWKTIADVCEPIAQTNPSKTPRRKFKYVDIASIDNTRNEIAETKNYSGEDAPSRARKPIETGDVLFSTVRPYLRNIASVPVELSGQIASTGFCVLRAKPELDAHYLFRHVLTNTFVQQVNDLTRGISYPAVTDRDIYSQSIPLPPLPEQQRIVARIESLFAESRTARDALERVPTLLKRFRQSVLASAFRGELTDDYVRAHGRAPLRHAPLRHAPLRADELPEGWTWTTVREVVSDVQPGFASGQKDVPDGIKHLRMNNIGADCQLNLDSVLTVPIELAKPRYLLQMNDVLVCHTNSAKLVGKAALFNVTGVYAFSNHLTRLRVAPDIIDPKWLWHVMATLWQERYFENRCKQWVNQATIERETLLTAPVPLAPLAEQRRIVAKIESLFAQADAIERAVAIAQQRADKIDQSILARAFRGEL